MTCLASVRMATAVAVALAVCSPGFGWSVDINPSNPDLGVMAQFPLVYPAGGGWVGYLPSPNPPLGELGHSNWGNDLGNEWGGNPNITNAGGTDGLIIRCDAQGHTSGATILEDQFLTADLTNASKATLSGTFRVRYTNNTTGMGTPILSLQLAGGPGISLNVGDKDYDGTPANSDRYWYQLVQYKQNSARRLLYAIERLNPANETAQEDPTYDTARLVVDANVDMVQLWWNGVKVWDNNGQPLTGFSNNPNDPEDLGIANSQASWGADTRIQPLPAQSGSGAEQKIFWHDVRLEDSGVCSTPSADTDADGDVDMTDFATLQLCYTGSTGAVVPSVVNGYLCGCLDRDSNNAVDSDDLVQFLNCASGPGVPWSQALTPPCVP